MKTLKTSAIIISMLGFLIGCSSVKKESYYMKYAMDCYSFYDDLKSKDLQYYNDTTLNNEIILNIINKRRTDNGLEKLTYDSNDLHSFAYHRMCQITNNLWYKIHKFNIPRLNLKSIKILEYGTMDTINNISDRNILKDIKKYTKIATNDKYTYDELYDNTLSIFYKTVSNYTIKNNIDSENIPQNIRDSLYKIGDSLMEIERERIKIYNASHSHTRKFSYDVGPANLSENLKNKTIQYFLNSEQGKNFNNIKEFIVESNINVVNNLLKYENEFLNKNIKKISFTRFGVGYKYWIVELSY